MGFELLDKTAIMQIVETAYRILEEIGVEIGESSTRTMLLDHRCSERDNRLMLSRELVHKALQSVPPSYKVWSRDLASSIELGGGSTFIHNFGGAPNVIDCDGTSGVRQLCRMWQI